MVFKSIQKIKTALPEVENIVMFYNNGTIFQTTLDQQYNIPKIGENLAESLEHLRKLNELSNNYLGQYKKLIYETEEMSIIILKLGEDSNLGLFFKKEGDITQKLKSIRKYLKRIENLIDTDKAEIDFQELKIKEEELKKLRETFENNMKNIENLNLELDSISLEQLEQRNTKEKDKNELIGQNQVIQKDIQLKEKQIEEILSKIEEARKKPIT